MEESAWKGKRRKIVGRGRGMKRRGTSDQMTHFLLCFVWWGGNSWFGGLREEPSLLFRVLKQTSTKTQSGASAEREKVGSLGGKEGRREEETSERGNFETREGIKGGD